MQSDKTIHTIGQVDVLLYLLAVIKKDEETDMQEFSQKQTKLETEKAITPDNDEILLLIENMRLFRQYNDLNIEENNTLQRHQGF